MMKITRYTKEMTGAMLAYVVVLLFSIGLLNRLPGLPTFARAVIALLPVMPGLLVCWVIVRSLGRMDELQRRIQLESFAVAFAGTALVTFSYGFLEGVGFPRLSLFVVWPVMCTLWVLSGLFRSWRYR